MIEKYLVSPALAKKMDKLGWEKEVMFCWVKLKSEKKSILCYHNLKNVGRFYTVEDRQLIPLWDVESWCYAPLFADILRELPIEIQYDIDISNMARLTMGMGTHANTKETDFCIYYEKDIGKELWESFFKDPNPAEATGELWCWDMEWSILQGLVREQKKELNNK